MKRFWAERWSERNCWNETSTFGKSNQIFFMIIPRTRFKVEGVCSEWPLVKFIGSPSLSSVSFCQFILLADWQWLFQFQSLAEVSVRLGFCSLRTTYYTVVSRLIWWRNQFRTESLPYDLIEGLYFL